jgi:phospholipid N-methyltransferase
MGLSQAMARAASNGPSGPMRVLEVGAGVGPVTAELVDRLLPGDRLDLVELNHEFCEVLRAKFAASAVRPTVHELGVLDFTSDCRYHHIVSGLPLANFPADAVDAIYKRFFDLLEPGGTLIMFEHVLGREALRVFGNPEHRERARRIVQIEAELEPLVVQKRLVALNMPPSWILVRRRPADGERKSA